MINPSVRVPVVLRVLIALGSLAAAAVTHAQNVTVTAANASNDAIYNVNFSNGTTTVLNTDGGSLHHIVSLVFVPNPSTFVLDLLAADNQGGTIVRYPGDFQGSPPTTKGTVIFSFNGTGPAYPDGLSLDGAGNLYVLNASPGNASPPQLWVFPSDGNGGFKTPSSIDSTSFVSNETVADTLVATTTVGPVNPGDVLVATSNPGQVLRYPGNGAGVGPLTTTTPSVLINLPAGAIPGGIAFWPVDNTLLVSTSRGTIYQYDLTTGNYTFFAQNLGNGQFKVRTGLDSGTPYAYVANNNGGDILRFSGPNQPPVTITANVQHPQGLAVTNIAYGLLSGCQDQVNGCQLFGSQQLVIKHIVPPPQNLQKPASGNIVEDICVVQVDPRLKNGGHCTDRELPVSQVCGGFNSTANIPKSLCGASGPTGQGFALIKMLTQSEGNLKTYPFNGNLVFSEADSTTVLPGASPLCQPSVIGVGPAPLGTIAWAPLLPGEGIVVEGNGHDLVELTDGCGSVTGHQAGLSVMAVGLALSEGDPLSLASYTDTKYQNVLATITSESGSGALPAASFPPENFTYQLQQCVKTSQAAFDTNQSWFADAAMDVLTANQQVASAAAPFKQVANYPNPFGALSSRLLSLYYQINTRMSFNQAGPPPAPAPVPPQISGTPAPTVVEKNLYTFTPGAQNYFANNEVNLTFSIVGPASLFTWASFDPNTGTLSGYAPKKTGTYSGIVITVTDGCASAALPAFSITVLAPGNGH